jgi:hypothetical protein
MKKLLLLLSVLLVTLTTLGQLSPVTAQTVPVVRVSPALVELEAGQSATIEIWVDDVAALFGFELEVRYNPAKISAASTTLGGFLEPGLTPVNTIDNVNGVLRYDMVQIGTGTTSKSGSGVLIRFEITLLEATSATPLVISSILLTDRDGFEIPCDTENGVVLTPGVSPVYTVYLPLVVY